MKRKKPKGAGFIKARDKFLEKENFRKEF